MDGRCAGSVSQQDSNTDQVLPLISEYVSRFGRQPLVIDWITARLYWTWKYGTLPVRI